MIIEGDSKEPNSSSFYPQSEIEMDRGPAGSRNY